MNEPPISQIVDVVAVMIGHLDSDMTKRFDGLESQSASKSLSDDALSQIAARLDNIEAAQTRAAEPTRAQLTATLNALTPEQRQQARKSALFSLMAAQGDEERERSQHLVAGMREKFMSLPTATRKSLAAKSIDRAMAASMRSSGPVRII